jgi:hypothetical protein
MKAYVSFSTTFCVNSMHAGQPQLPLLNAVARPAGIFSGTCCFSLSSHVEWVAGQPQLPLNAVGTWLGQQEQAAMKAHVSFSKTSCVNSMHAGQPHLPLLNAVGTWLGQQVQAAMKSESQPGGRLAGLLNVATPSGRKLQQVHLRVSFGYLSMELTICTCE